MQVPKAMLLRLLKAAIADGSITRDEVVALFPRARGRKITPKEILDAARAEGKNHQLSEDGLRFGVQIRSSGYKLILVRRADGKTPAPGLGEMFSGVEDIGAAADALVLQYLRTVSG